MITISDPNKCCGCSACANICNQNAIIMKPDALGFAYPHIDINKCTNCGLCEKICQFNPNYDTNDNLKIPLFYGGRHKIPSEVAKSQSGAAFIAIRNYILKNNGIIYGVGFGKNHSIIHKRATTLKETEEFRGSKYVQSDLSNIFKSIKADLKNDLLVLFVGTPCQTAGLKKYIGNKWREKLILVDIICHGVGSPYIWNDYVKYLEQRHGKISNINFRQKEDWGWKSHREVFKFENAPNIKRIFPHLYYRNLFHRPSCSKCPYTNIKRPSDITIGDFWGLSGSYLNDNLGCSLFIINTEKGKSIFNQIKGEINYFETKAEKCLQPNLKYPTPEDAKRKNFEIDYKKYGFSYVWGKYNIAKTRAFYRMIKLQILIWKLKLKNYKLY